MKCLLGVALVLVCIAAAAAAHAESLAGSGDAVPDPGVAAAQADTGVAAGASAMPAAGRDLYLAVSINGRSVNLVAAFHQDADGTLSIDTEQLRNVGIMPAKAAATAGGRVRIDRLPSVRFAYDEANQTIDFTAADGQRAPRIIDASKPRGSADEKKPRLRAQSSYGALLNYGLVASSDNSETDGRFAFSGLSGAFEARLFGPAGVLDNTFIASTARNSTYNSVRLDNSWSYSDQSSMITYNAGDVITGGLSWTRPTRLGGLQIERNFTLRSDLVTFPVPELSGSAAVPSTVDVYLNDARRFSGSVDAGPFDLTNLPIVDGTGNAQLVVTDAQGQQVTTSTSFIASDKLLKPRLTDFSAELGFARQNYGIASDDYDTRPYGSATARAGVTNWLTIEGHAEGGADLLNGGIGAVFASQLTGVVSVSAAGSLHAGTEGRQFAASLERQMWNIHLAARTQRSFGNYQDIASVTAKDSTADTDLFALSAMPPKALDQISLSFPLPFRKANLNLSFTHAETAAGTKQKIVGLSFSRPIFHGSTFSVSALKDLQGNNSGVYASLMIPIGHGANSTTSASTEGGQLDVTETLSHPQGQQIGDYGWSVSRQQTDNSIDSASASYRTPVAQLGARIDQRGSLMRVNATADGALVLAGGDVFAANRIDDAFAVVDAGAPDVAVQSENRPAGTTDRKGKLLLPHLHAYQKNEVSIDPTNLPLDAVVNETRAVVMPADRSGVLVKFDVNTNASAALVTFVGPDGKPLEIGASGKTDAKADPFVIGYDGQALVEHLATVNRISITRRDGTACTATFPYKPQPGKQVNIPNVPCKP